MDVLLIALPGKTAERLYSMYEAGGLTAVLRQNGFHTEILDGDDFCINPFKVVEIVKNVNPLLVSVILQWDNSLSSHWFHELVKGFEIQKTVKHLNVVGRVATIFHKRILSELYTIDSVVIGEGEITLLELTKQLAQHNDWRAVKGIAYRNNGNNISHSLRPPILDLDYLPFPARDYLQDRRKYPIAPMYTSRYCYGKCNFCMNKVYRDANPNNKYRARSATKVVDEIESLVQNYRTITLYFVDNNFFVDGRKGIDRAVEIANEIIKRNLKIRFYMECRVNDVKKPLFTLLKKAGLRRVLLGIESGAQSVLNRFKKGTTVEMNKKAINILRELHINCEPGFIMFEPSITFDELKQNLEFIRLTELNYSKSVSTSIFNRLIIYPGSEIDKLFDHENEGDPDNFVTQYKIVDKKVRLAEKMIGLYQKEINRQMSIYNKLQIDRENWYKKKLQIQKLPQSVAQNNSQLKLTFRSNLGKWLDGFPGLDLKILEKIVHFLDGVETLSTSEINSLKEVLLTTVNEYHLGHFSCSFEKQIERMN